MTPDAIRELGDGLSRARELCQEAQYDKGMQLYETTLSRLRQFVRKMSKMSERQPWLQMQIELENELNLIADYVELMQAFKAPPGAVKRNLNARKDHHYRSPGPVDEPASGGVAAKAGGGAASPHWEIYTPGARNQVLLCTDHL
ncbi:hypothetical protein ATCC90586_010487 [Pythium insidiosum]|nr:hypothetical protein ATCC90586_010487 [Pythium insidiosum]